MKILFPQNIFYVLIEFLHYRNPNSTNSFLSEIEVERFKKVYGNTTAKCVVIYPRIHKKLLSAKHKSNYSIQNSECIKCIFIAYNPLLKGFDVIQELTELNPKLKFFIFGKDNLNVNNKNIINMGRVPLNEIDFSKYDLFIYPSKLDSYAFVLEESLRMNLIPFFTKEVGCGEIFSFTNTRHSLLINSKNLKLTNDKINDVISSVNKSSILISKLEELRNKLENEDYIDYFEGKLKKINKSF
ncbi:MAG: hypothetical protein CMM96_00685 [Rickettsiales bacterium]|nr:hypothetical protein [Rickettsiales bacterium]